MKESQQGLVVTNPENLRSALGETAVTVVALGFFCLLPIGFSMSAMSSINQPLLRLIMLLVEWMLKLTAEFIYIMWSVMVISLILETLWNLLTKKNWKLSALKAVIFGSSMLFFQNFAILLQ